MEYYFAEADDVADAIGLINDFLSDCIQSAVPSSDGKFVVVAAEAAKSKAVAAGLSDLETCGVALQKAEARKLQGATMDAVVNALTAAGHAARTAEVFGVNADGTVWTKTSEVGALVAQALFEKRQKDAQAAAADGAQPEAPGDDFEPQSEEHMVHMQSTAPVPTNITALPSTWQPFMVEQVRTAKKGINYGFTGRVVMELMKGGCVSAVSYFNTKEGAENFAAVLRGEGMWTVLFDKDVEETRAAVKFEWTDATLRVTVNKIDKIEDIVKGVAAGNATEVGHRVSGDVAILSGPTQAGKSTTISSVVDRKMTLSVTPTGLTVIEGLNPLAQDDFGGRLMRMQNTFALVKRIASGPAELPQGVVANRAAEPLLRGVAVPDAYDFVPLAKLRDVPLKSDANPDGEYELVPDDKWSTVPDVLAVAKENVGCSTTTDIYAYDVDGDFGFSKVLDTPGTHDTRGLPIDVRNTMVRLKALRQCGSIRLAVVVDLNQIVSAAGQKLPEFLAPVACMLRDYSKSIKDATVLLTRVTPAMQMSVSNDEVYKGELISWLSAAEAQIKGLSTRPVMQDKFAGPLLRHLVTELAITKAKLLGGGSGPWGKATVVHPLYSPDAYLKGVMAAATPLQADAFHASLGPRGSAGLGRCLDLRLREFAFALRNGREEKAIAFAADMFRALQQLDDAEVHYTMEDSNLESVQKEMRVMLGQLRQQQTDRLRAASRAGDITAFAKELSVLRASDAAVAKALRDEPSAVVQRTCKQLLIGSQRPTADETARIVAEGRTVVVTPALGASPFHTAPSIDVVSKSVVGVTLPAHQIGDMFVLAKKLAQARAALSGFVADIRGDISLRRIVALAEIDAVVADAQARKEAAAFIAKVNADLTSLQDALRTDDYPRRDALRGKLRAEAESIEAKLLNVEAQCRDYGQKLTRMQAFDYVPKLDEHGGCRKLLTEAEAFASTAEKALTRAIDQYTGALELLTTNVVAVMMNSTEEIERRCVALDAAANSAELILEALGMFCEPFGAPATSLPLRQKWRPLQTFVTDFSRVEVATSKSVREAMVEVEAVVTAVANLRTSLSNAGNVEIDSAVLDSSAALSVASRLCSLSVDAREAAEDAEVASRQLARLERKGTVTDTDREIEANALRQKRESAAALAAAFKRYYQPLMVHYSETRDILNQEFPAGDPASYRRDVSLSQDFIAVTDGPARVFSDCVTLMTERATGVSVMLKRFRIEHQLQFRRECDALRRVKHPYVAELRYTFFEHSDKSHYMVLPYYAGGTLDEWVRLVADDAEALLRAFMQIAEGLAALHANGITHCDVKPSNIVMTSKLASAMPRIIDFDFAKLVVSDFSTTVSRTMSGSTAGFATPEFIEFMEKGLQGREAADMAQRLRSPSVDAYAFGRTLAVLIDPSNHINGFRMLTFPDADFSRIASALAPFATELEGIVTGLVAALPEERMTLAQAQPKLAALWAAAHKPRSDAAERDAKPVECCICYSEVAQREAIACAVAPERLQPSHVYCRECFNTNVTSWGALSPMDHVATNGALFCTHPTAVGVGGRCAGTFDNSVALSLLMPDHLPTVQRVFGQVRELETLAAVKRQAEARKSDIDRAVAHIDEVIRALRCPGCQTPSVIDFLHCMQLTCTLCETTFCAYCVAITDTSHRHVAEEHQDEGLYLFATEDVWRRHWHKVKHEEVSAFIKTLPTAIQAEVELRTR